MEVIYLVTPTLETINLILRDFADPKKPRYGDVHLFFLSKVFRDKNEVHRCPNMWLMRHPPTPCSPRPR